LFSDLKLLMTPTELKRQERRLEKFMNDITGGLGRLERRCAMQHYVVGLMLDGDRKSMTPIAGRLVDQPDEVEAMRQRLQECVNVAAWDELELYRRLGCKLVKDLPNVHAYVLDDTTFVKKGEKSVGVASQYSGTTGRTENCQTAVSLHVASETASGCVGMRLYLPGSWADDRKRCAEAGVPEDIAFKTKPSIAIDLLDRAIASGLPRFPVLADLAYGNCAEFRDALSARQLQYVVAIRPHTKVWRPGEMPRLRRWSGKGRPTTTYEDAGFAPVEVSQFSKELKYRRVRWRNHLQDDKVPRFAAVRIRTSRGHWDGKPPGEECWLISEWVAGESQPSRFYLSNLPPTTSLKQLAKLIKTRWRVERDYQEMKEELGLDHYEGRKWRGFHHHFALCAAAHAFLALSRALFPPEQLDLDTACGAARNPNTPAPSNRSLPALSHSNFVA
jgi:SRSO17 transposase